MTQSGELGRFSCPCNEQPVVQQRANGTEPLLLCRYEVYTVSRPATPLAAISYPVIRLLQKRFASDSCRTMRTIAAG